MRKPKKGDRWRLDWMKHKPIKEIDHFSPIWVRTRNTVVPGVWFYHAPKGKTIYCSVRFLLERGTLISEKEMK